MGSMEGGGAPLLNDYKLEFFWKRFPQTLLGGPRLKLGYEAPFYVYIYQVLVYLTPFVLGGLFTVLAEFDIITDAYVNSYIYGSLMVIFVLSTQLFSWFMRRRSSNLAKFQKNLLAQDDEVDFVSCCGFETVEFIFPGKKFVVNMVLHGLISGVLCALMFLYLLPSTLNGLFSDTGATVVVFILGWWVVCIAQYSLTSKPPTELAIFRALDSLEVTPLMRPFYVLLFGIIGVLARSYPELVSVDKALHILFLFLPLLWTLGILPPLDALISWLAEQVLALVLGGSPMATDLRLLLMFLLSSLVVVMATFITSNTANIIISGCFGFILSMDIFGFALQMQDKLSGVETIDPALHWKLKEVIIFVVMLSLTAVIAGVSSHFSSSGSSQIFESFGFVFLVLCVLVKILGDIQSVSIFFGLFRNPFYPTSIDSSGEFKKRKKTLKYKGLVRQALLFYVSPLLQVAFLSLFLIPEQPGVSNFILAIGTVRALRQVWQNTFHSLLEVSVVCLSTTAFGSDVAAWWASAGLGLQLMLVGACRNRLQQLLDKVFFMMTLAVTSWKLPKQRHKSTVAILMTSTVLFPAVIAILGMSAVLAAPLLPLFCLPVFLIGFPRPLRSWPSAASTAAASCPDSVYYKQLMPQVISTLSVSVSVGALGNLDPGDHFLVRFQDRLIWVHVLESGYKYCTMVLKGLELQETSCHTVEATRVDDVFQDIFVHEGKWPLVSLNKHVSNALRPCDSLVMKTYSDAKNVLTGVIDRPENLRRNSENFFKTLVWVLVKYCKEHEFDNKNSSERHVPVSIPEEETVVQVPVHDSPIFKPKEVVLDRLLSQHNIELHNLPKTSLQQEDQSTAMVTTKRRRSGSLPSLSDSVWSQESLKLEDSFTSLGKQKPLQNFDGHPISDEGVEDDLEVSLNLGGFPALDIGRPKVSSTQRTSGNPPKQVNPVSTDLHHKVANSGVFSNNVSASSTVQLAAFTSEHAYKLDMPSNWKFSIPVDKHHIDSLSSKFPDFWLRHVIMSQNFGNDNKTVAQSIINDPALIGFYKQLTCACYALVEVLGFPGSSATAAGPGHVHKVYSGDIPWSVSLDWLEKDTQLKSLVLKAYRYAFKLTYDEAVLGEVTSEDELVEYLTEYDKDWYLGSEMDRDWQTSIMADKPFLFSLGRDKSQGTYTSRVLTKQEVIAPVGRLNGECVRGQWASLALELLYLTNDDEERYSIQAHPTLLRNLTIQAADPPLGYPVYSSGAISASLVVAPL